MQSLIHVAIVAAFGLLFAGNAHAGPCDQLDPTKRIEIPFHTVIGCLQDQIRDQQKQIEALKADVKQLDELKADIKRLKGAIYSDIDAVYTISEKFTKQTIMDLREKQTFAFSKLIYADLRTHAVEIVVARRYNSFNFNLCINKSCKLHKNDIEQPLDITDDVRTNPLRADNAGVPAPMLEYPAHIQLIELRPVNLNWDESDESSIDGYIIVRRKDPSRQKTAGGLNP